MAQHIEQNGTITLPSLQEWCDKHEASRIVGRSASTLRDWLLSGKLVEGIHWVRFGPRCVRYNAELLRDFVAIQPNPNVHRRAVDNYLASLPSNKPKVKARKLV
jgi:hypothetical protein